MDKDSAYQFRYTVDNRIKSIHPIENSGSGHNDLAALVVLFIGVVLILMIL